MIKPPVLKKGDKIATVTLSWGGPGVFPDRYIAGKRQLEETFGVRVVEMKHTLKSADWIYANPQARADDFMEAFQDSSINGIVSSIGGDESVRILPYIDFNIIRANPKVFMGYSDTTIAHLACYKAGLVSFYGPSIMAGFAENGGIFKYTEESVRKSVFSSEKIGVIAPSIEGWTCEHLDWGKPENQNIRRLLRNKPTGPKVLQGQGKVSGHLLGGCPEVLEMAKATSVWPDLDMWRGAIVFLETSEEAPDLTNFSRWIRNYGAQGILGVINGILLARPGGQIDQNEISKYDKALLEVVAGEYGLNNLPVISQLDFGHTDPMFVIPYGVGVEIDCESAGITILENAVV